MSCNRSDGLILLDGADGCVVLMFLTHHLQLDVWLSDLLQYGSGYKSKMPQQRSRIISRPSRLLRVVLGSTRPTLMGRVQVIPGIRDPAVDRLNQARHSLL